MCHWDRTTPVILWNNNKFINHLHLVSNIVFFFHNLFLYWLKKTRFSWTAYGEFLQKFLWLVSGLMGIITIMIDHFLKRIKKQLFSRSIYHHTNEQHFIFLSLHHLKNLISTWMRLGPPCHYQILKFRYILK
jgi:hypothetical protein